MTRKSIIVLLIFVVIAGAIAGAFVFLGQMGAGGSSAIPNIYSSANGTGVQQSSPQYGGNIPPNSFAEACTYSR